jgi:acetyl esterase/lipase
MEERYYTIYRFARNNQAWLRKAFLIIWGVAVVSGCKDTTPEPAVPSTVNEGAFVLETPLYAGVAPDNLPILPGTAAATAANAAGIPTLTVYAPEQSKATGTAVVICPAGGYEFLSMYGEGYDIANYLVGQGITAIVLRYRLPNPLLQSDPSVAPLLDIQQSLRMVRRNAAAWHLRADRVGIMGFSAGGHLAATAGTRWTSPRTESMGTESIKPDFLVLSYAVISMTDSLTHLGSRQHLLGSNPSPQQIQQFSADQQVTSATPPTYLVHAADDPIVSVSNSRAFYRACMHHNVPAQLLIYPSGGHSFGLYNPSATGSWAEPLFVWLRGQNLLK